MPTAGTRTSTRQGRATVRPTNYYARTFAGRLAASGLEQTPEGSHGAPGFLPALTHFTGAVDAFPKEMINHFSMFKEVEAKLHDPEQMLKGVLDEIAHLPTTTNAETRQSFEQAAAVRKRQLFYRLRVLVSQMIPTLDEKLVVLQATKVTTDKGLMRMHHSHAQLDGEISDEARYGSLAHWAYADKEEKKKGGTTHDRQRREVAAANNLAAAAQHVHDVDSIAAKSEVRREGMGANKRSRQQQQQADSDFDDRPTKKQPQKRKPLPADTHHPTDARSLGLGIASNGTVAQGKRKKTEKALAASLLAAPPMERSLSGALKAAGGPGRSGSSPRATPALESGAASKRRPRAPPVPAQRKNQLPPYSPDLASSPLAANFAINRAIAGAADRPLSARARKTSIANSTASANAPEPAGRRPSSSHSVQHIASSNAIAELEHAAGIVRDSNAVQSAVTPQNILDSAQPFEPMAMKQEELAQQDPDSMDMDMAGPAARAGRASKTATPVAGTYPDVPMARSRSTRNANNSNSNASSENNSTTTGSVSKRGHKKNGPSTSNATIASPAVKPAPNAKSNAPSSAASSIAPDQENEYQDVESEEDGDEPRYCYCNEVSYGNMVACDNDDCPREWFHLACVNLDKAPLGRTKWFCSDECKEHHAKTKTKGGRPGSSRQ